MYKAYDRNAGREVAWNEIDARNLPRSATKRLMAEVAMLQTLNHRRLIAFHAAWRTKTGVVLITELVTSGTLKQCVARLLGASCVGACAVCLCLCSCGARDSRGCAYARISLHGGCPSVSITRDLSRSRLPLARRSFAPHPTVPSCTVRACRVCARACRFLKRVVRVRLCVIKKFCLQILEGLHYLHTHKPVIIHRDLKCENILVNGSSGELLISDFGLSTQVSARKAHSVLGTPPLHCTAPLAHARHAPLLCAVPPAGTRGGGVSWDMLRGWW